MKSKMVYIAEDGIEFDNEKECLSYEKKKPLVKLMNFIASELNSNHTQFSRASLLANWLYTNKDIILEYYETKPSGIDTILSKYFFDKNFSCYSINSIMNIIDNEQNYLQYCFFQD